MSAHRSVAIFEKGGRRGLNSSICTLLNSSPRPRDDSRRRSGAVAKLQMFCAERRYCDNTHACSFVVNFEDFTLLCFPLRVHQTFRPMAWPVEAVPVSLR